MFLFSCWTGICYCDMRSLTAANLVRADDGSLWIHTERQKTGTPECVRLMEIPLKIVEKYKGMDSNGKLLPMLTKESMNRHLKKMSVMCGINRPISFHQARHTFGSIICLSQGIPIETVSKIMGHRHITTTQRYAKVTQDKIDRDVDCLNGIISGRFSLSEHRHRPVTDSERLQPTESQSEHEAKGVYNQNNGRVSHAKHIQTVVLHQPSESKEKRQIARLWDVSPLTGR